MTDAVEPAANPAGDTPPSDARNILISGGSGFIGTELTTQLRRAGHTVTLLVRHPTRNADERMWDPDAGWLNPEVIERADAVINLSGASISKLPWTLSYKRTILESRVNATTTLAAAIAKAKNPPAVFLSGSAVGYYGDRPGEVLTEQSGIGEGFLPKVVDAWERASRLASPASRVVNVRTGVVLGQGGLTGTLKLIAKLGGAGPLGSGTQHWPWISLYDEAAGIRHLLSSELEGPVNLAGPTPATAADVMRTIAEQVHRPYWLPAPAWAIKGILADAGRELILSDQNQSPQLLLDDGFVFRDVDLEQTVEKALAG
ncbi:TIGR01777 family oxidoreductase [Subtercola boreus]|uniref:TIGR01777 family protein n=1 Tax=Subtercola boreus TaxID=120213 RepID=A0A3E0WAC5_9MICO|nr:TIGR01777 family oxidoreductase [Subtercola boreus]RFA20818.1 TIGR01777 family protein [Subtercola boreus]RFA20933.1 TIGR01777 family protein [Subtercola boreus]RFA27126.1 TIGR01777 family protein [Subtercola boreus]